MHRKNSILLAAIVFPIIALLFLTVYKQSKVSFGKKIIIPIEGYDPRDILSGHYLIYRLSLNIKNYDSEKYGHSSSMKSSLCITQNKDDTISSMIISSDNAASTSKCDAVLKGQFRYSRFIAGIERFYIPEKHALQLDRIIRKGNGKIIVSIDKKGNPAVKDLLINNRSWKEYIK